MLTITHSTDILHVYAETLTYMSYSLTRLLSHTVTKFPQESQLTYVCESILSISLERHSHPGMHRVQVFISLL